MDFSRSVMAHPCNGSSARIFRRSRSRVPWTRSFGLLISVSEMSIRELLSVSKGKLAARLPRLPQTPVAGAQNNESDQQIGRSVCDNRIAEASTAARHGGIHQPGNGPRNPTLPMQQSK